MNDSSGRRAAHCRRVRHLNCAKQRHSQFRGRRNVRLLLQRRPYRRTLKSKNEIKTVIKVPNWEILVCNVILLFWNRAVVLGCVWEYFIIVGTTVHATYFSPIHNVNASRSLGEYELHLACYAGLLLNLESPVVTICTTSLTISNVLSPHCTMLTQSAAF